MVISVNRIVDNVMDAIGTFHELRHGKSGYERPKMHGSWVRARDVHACRVREEGKILIRHERKAEFPQDKTQLIARLKQTGQYDSLSMPNYSRIRSDIVKGTADPEIAKMANIENVDKIYVKKKDE